MAALRGRSGAPFGVNVFTPLPERPEEVARIPAYAERLAPMAEALGVGLGEPRHTDDDFAAKVDLLVEVAPGRRLVRLRPAAGRRGRPAARRRVRRCG